MTNLVVSDNKVFKYIINSSSFDFDLLIRFVVFDHRR